MLDDRQPEDGGPSPVDLARIREVFKLVGTVYGMSIRGDKEAKAMSDEIDEALCEWRKADRSQDLFAPIWALEDRIRAWFVIRRKSN